MGSVSLFRNEMVNLKTFELPYGKYMLKGDRSRIGTDQNSTILLHGAGKSSRLTFSRLRKYLYFHGFSSASFDFVGHGGTGGNIQETTLHGRSDQAAMVIKHMCQEPLTVIAASMGSYNAIKLTEHFRVKHLILLVPAVYTPQVYDISFGPEFSAIIRKHQSWKDSDAFDIISRFGGTLTIVAAEFDDVIPAKLIEQLYASATSAENRILYRVPNSNHLSLFPKEKNFLATMKILLGVLTGGTGRHEE